MRFVAAPLGLVIAMVFALLAVTEVINMEATMRPLTSGGLRTLIDTFDFLMLLVAMIVGLALIGGVVAAITRGR